MEYHDALRYLYSLVDYEKRRVEQYSTREFKIERMFDLLGRLGNPHQAYPSVHIAGTKGKGSVSAMMAAIAQVGGQRTALYTSPHLHTYRERMQIDGEPISRAALAALIEEVKPAIESVEGITLFEATTAIAFLYFARERVDFAVIEVGLGGRLDATNVIIPEISVITSLSLDHTAILGNTLPEIAREKAGIIKPRIPVVTAPQRPDALAVLQTIAAEREAPLTVVGQTWVWEPQQHTADGQTLTIRRTTDVSHFDGTYGIPLIGDFQQENATVAIATAAALHDAGHTWANPDTAHTGLRQTQWPGRMEVLQRDPLVILDCAHNPYSIETLIHSLDKWFPQTRWILVYGASADKNIGGMLEALLPACEHVVVTGSHHPRAVALPVLVEMCADLGKVAEVAASPDRALEQAYRHMKPGLGILATGSVYLVADVREAWASEHDLVIPLGDWVDQPW